MKPVNSKELNKGYRKFILYFALLVFSATFCVFLYFSTSKHEVMLLNQKVRESERLLQLREEISHDFDLILSRLKEISRYTRIDAEEYNSQALLQDQIQRINMKVRQLVQQETARGNHHDNSLALYEKMTDDVTYLSGIQDSLFNTRSRIESLRTQLEACNKNNQKAAQRLKRGRFGN